MTKQAFFFLGVTPNFVAIIWDYGDNFMVQTLFKSTAKKSFVFSLID